jgi:predicted XRE-type DNA-binding protein
MPLDYNEFAEKIKQKYPEYKDIDNYTLTTKMIEKYPEYKTQVVLKKKEVSQSTLGQSNTSSGRLSNTTTKPTASSSSPEILTDYLGKSKKKYKFEDNQWYEENPNAQVAKSTPSKFGGTNKTYGQELKFNPNAAQGSWKPIEEESRIKALNYYYKKDGSLATEEKVFTNYDAQKKDNLYRIKNGQWERKVPKGYFAPVNDEIATQALNKRYGQNVVFTPTKPQTVKKEDPKFMDINSNLTAKTEEDAIGYLEKNYGKYGFEFNQEGLFYIDQIRVKTKDGKKEEVFEFDEKNPEEAARLRAFLEENKSKPYSSTYNYLDQKVRSQVTGIPKGEGRTQQEIQDYLRAAQIKKGLYILSDDYLNNFKKLDADEMKDQITNVIGKSGLDAKTIQDFYKTDAYKAYKTKKADLNKAENERLNGYYDELKYARVAKDKAKEKEAQNKIDAYLTNDVIADNVKNYDMQLNDLKNRNTQLETEYADYEKQVNKFNSEKAIIDQKVKSGEISREQYNGMVEGLNNRADQLNDLSENIQTKAQKIKLETDNVSTSQKKLNYVAGKYVAAKEKEGGAIGFAVNSILNGVSGAFIEPFANYAALGNQYEDLSPEEKQYYKDKKYTKDQVENILDNKAILKAKNEAKEMLISSVGFEETTQEYMKSGDRGFIATALGGVLQSLPAMATGVLGKAASFTGLAAQAYSGIEEEMLNDPDFQTTSVGERSIIAIPYAIGMGILENAGLTNMIKSNSVTGKALQGLVAKVIEKAPKGATQDIINKLVTKEIESNLAKGVIKITQAGLAEFETGATQSLVLDQGLKQLYNIYAQRNMNADEKKNLSQGEFFDTADSFGELKTQTFEDGLAEMIGGVTLGAVGTLSQRILKGNVSIYNSDDVEFLKNVAQDDNFKKLFVANLKTSMLNGSMTKGQAQDKLDALNEIQAVFTKLPPNISKDQMKQAMDLVVEKTKLEKERTKKDPALVAAQTERINAINEELKTISQNAVQEPSTKSEISRPGETGETVTEGGEGVGQRVKGQVFAEEVSKAKEEVDQYIADAGSEARIGSAINPLVEKMAAAENIDDADIDNAIETIFNEVDSLEKSDQYSPETKRAISEKLLNIADKLDNYEFRTTTEIVETTKAGTATATRKTSEAVQKINAERYFNGVTATVNGEEVTLTDNKGRVETTMPNGEVIVLDTPTIQVVEDGFEFDDNGALEAVTVTDRLGNTVRFTGDTALDLAIRDRENKLGVVEQAEFETAYQEVKKNYVKEAPAPKTVEAYRAEEQAELQEAIPNIEDYKTDGEIDKALMPDDVLAKYNEIYNKYDKLISPLLKKQNKNLDNTKKETNLAPDETGKQKAGNRLFNEPLKGVAEIANRYYQRIFGSKRPKYEGTTELNVERAKRIAAAFEAMKHEPNNPEVRKAYEAMAKETIDQYQAFLDAGFVVEINNEEPYANSADMIEDLRQNKRIKIFSTEAGFGDDPITPEQRAENPLLATTEFTDVNGQPMLVNDLFRAVHDFFGHAELGNSFGPKGEENAWNVHARMYSPLARRAMTTETRGQNSWVNFSGFNDEIQKLRDKAAKLRDEGKTDEAVEVVGEIYDKFKFADQKIGLLPIEFSEVDQDIEETVSQTENELTERNVRTMSVKYKRNPIVRAAVNVLKALPGVKIYLHENADQYSSALANKTDESKQSIEKSAGSYIDGEIHLDMSKADLVTLLHEAVHHALEVNGIKGKYIIDMAKGLRGIIKDKDRLAELDEFVSRYEEETDQETLETRSDEFMAQLGGILAANQEELTTSGLTKFMALINRIFKKLGLGNVFTKASTSQDAVNFINAITRGLNVGEDVSGKYNPETGKVKRQAVTIMEGKESMQKFGLKEGKNITRKIGEALEARQRAKYGTIAQKDNSPEARKKISNWMVDEVKYFVGIMGDKSGKGWYGELYQNSLDAMSKIFPEMKTDQNARDLFTMLVAITSDGQKVMSNFRLAAAAYDYYKKNGVMPDTLPGQRVSSFEANLKRINELLNEYNGDIATIKEKLMEVKSIQEINQERKKEGLEPLSTNWPVSFKAPFAASVFGPKLGMFYSNLSGNEAYPTLDRWWSRTFNRYRGTLIPAIKGGFTKKGEAIGLDRFKELLGTPGMSNEEALLASKSYRDSYAAKGYKNGTDVEKAANTIYKTAFENLNDAPFTKNDRQFMYDTISDAVNKLNKQGYELSIADVQAILWYFEKNLYKTLGVQAKIEGISYEDAANYTYDKWKEAGNKFDYKINEIEEGQSVEDADEDIEEEEAKPIKRKKQLTQNWVETPVKNMNDSPIAKNSDKVRSAAVDLIKGKIDQEDYIKTVEKYSPIGSIGTLFAPATTEHMELALGKKADKLMAPVVDENGNKLKKVGTRLDIPSYLNKNAWVVTVHDERIKNGPVVSYRNAVKLKNVEFSTDPRMALNIAAGLMGKSTFARMVGEMEDIPGTTAEEQGMNAQAMVEEIMNDPNWIQVGMNPFRHSFFWNRANGMPVVSADEVIQIGGLVYAKNAKEVPPNSDKFTVYGKYDESKNKVVASDEPMLDKSGKKIKFQKIAPNGQPSNLNEKQWEQVRTPEFKKWFGDWENDPENASKVVDENGEPLVVFHGGKLFNVFNKGVGVDKGIYFTDNKYFAQDIFALKIEISERDKRDFEYDDVPEEMLESNEWDEKYFKYSKIYEVFLNVRKPKIYESLDAKIIPKTYSENIDGVIVNSTGDFGYKGNQIVVFEPNQIKSATENVGTFSAETPKIKFQKAPKILGQKPTVVIVNDEAKALIDQIKLEVRAQREQKKAQTEVRKSISDSVKAMVKKGSISLKQASTIISTLNRVNLDNPEMVKRFNDYIAKVFDRAEYIDKVERANRMKKKIKANLKGASNPFAIAAKGFSQLEPKWVENIDDYIMIAQAVYDSVKKSTARKGVINWKQEADFQVVAEYVFDEEARQTEMLLGNLRSLYERITGESSDGVPADVMQAELKDLNIPEDFSADVLDQIEQKLAEFEQMVEDTDPEVVKKAASIDPTIIPTKEAIRILDALDTYFMNGSTAGLDDLMNLYIGKENAIKFKKKGKPLRSFGSKILAQTKFKQLTQFNMILERKFRTKEDALAYKKASGIQDIENGANKAEAQAMRKQREYMTKFGKIKGFNSAENIFQRGALANLLRTMVASEELQQAEFDRNITILRNSVDTLSKGNANDQKKAKVYKKVLTELGVFRSDVDLEMVLKNAKKENIDAVDFVIDMFGEIVDPLSDLALGMYNQILTQDVNYTPYVYKMTDLKKTFGSNQDNSSMDFFGVSNYANQTFDKNKAGVLMPITRPKNLRNGMHIDLDFDNNMFRQYRNALVDLYTAGPIRQFEGFFNSEENENILGSNEDQEIIKSAMVDYVRTKKGSNFITDDGLGFLNKISDYMAQFGAARALVGIGQFVNQFSSGMTNTIVNAGEYIRPGDFSKEMFDFMANSGRSIANVGGDEILIAMGDIDKSIERADLSNRPDQYVLKFIAKENMRLFNIMVAYPDSVARKLAWMAYYRKSMVEQGLLGFTESVDTTKLNDTAADYAQLMVDRNMDATDATLRGSLFRNRNASVKILRSIFMPFASFGINQKNRMWNDLNALASGRDITTSVRSIVSIAAELVVYNGIRYYVAQAILGAALELLGYDDDDQEELYNKLLNNAKLSSWSKLFTDIVSPLPLLDNQTLNLANKAMKGSSLFAADPEAVQKYVDKLKAKGNLTDEEIEEKKLAFEEKNARSFYVDTEANIGTLGIQYEKAIELMDLVDAWNTGEYVDDNNNERFLSKESREKLTAPLMMKFAATVYGTRELDQIANKSFKLVKDAESMSKTQQENYKEVKKELGRDLTEFERGIIKEKRTFETALQIIKFVDKNGGLNKEKGSEYLKLLEVYPKPGKKMLIDIQNGQKAADIIKRNTE